MSDFIFRGPAWLIKTTGAIGTIATVASLVLLYLDITDRLVGFTGNTVVWADTALCLVMLTEWIVLLRFADNRRAFIKARWIDLISSIPLLVIMRPFRIVRLVRLLRLLRGVSRLAKVLRPWRDVFSSSVIKSAASVTAVLVLFGALAVMDIERGNESMDTYPEALWWAMVTTTTVGYGDAVPETNGGRFIASVLMVLGIGFFGSFAAAVTVACSCNHADLSNQELLIRLEAMEARIIRQMST